MTNDANGNVHAMRNTIAAKAPNAITALLAMEPCRITLTANTTTKMA